MSPYGDDGIRTHDPLLAGQVLSQLSYTPMWFSWLCLSLSMNNRFQFNPGESLADSLVIAGLLASQLSSRDRGHSLKIEQQFVPFVLLSDDLRVCRLQFSLERR